MAVRFDVATDRVTYVAGGTGDPPDTFTVVLWVYLSVNLGGFTSLYRRYTTGGSGRGQIGTDSDGVSVMWWPAGVSFNHTMTVGQWSRIAVVVSGGTATTYAGGPTGSLTTNSGGAGTTAPANNITLSGLTAGNGSEWLNGRLARVRTWSVALNAAQIAAEFASLTPVVTSGLWADWDLPNASDLTDHAGSRHLAAGSTAVTTEDGPPSGDSFTDAGTATITLGATGTHVRTAPASGSATITLGTAGTATKTTIGTGTADVALGASGTAVHTAADTGAAVLALALTGGHARAAAASGLAALTLGGDGTSIHIATDVGTAVLTLLATGVVDSDAAGTALLTLGAVGAHTAVRGGAGAALLTLLATGTTPAVDVPVAGDPRLTIRPNRAAATVRGNRTTLTMGEP